MKNILKVELKVFLFMVMISYGTARWNYFCQKCANQTLWILRRHLLCDYDPYTRPRLDHKVATNVSVMMVLKSFTYDEYSHLLTINAWTSVIWTDDHLKWNPGEYDGIESTHIETDAIWTPDLTHYNRYEQDKQHQLINDVNCHLRHTGRIFCLSPGKYESLCTARLTQYPYDVQKCALLMGSWIHTGEEVNVDFLGWGIYADELSPNPEWDLIETKHVRSNGKDPTFPNMTFPSIAFIFIIERQGGLIEATAIVPSLGLVMMTLMILLLDVIDSNRTVLIICNVLMHTIYLQYVSWNVPKFGDNIPKIILFGRDSMVIVFVELTLTILLKSLKKNHKTASNWRMEMIEKVLESRVGNMIIIMDFKLKNIEKLNKSDDNGENIIENVQPNNKQHCILFAKLMDRLCFISFSIAYFIMIIKFIF